MDETPDEPGRPDQDHRGQQNDPTAKDPLGGQPPPPDEYDDDEDEDEYQAPSRRRILGGRRLAAAGFAVVVLLGGGAALALSGGGGNGDDTTSSSDDDNGSSPEDAAFEFAQCMRDNGIEEFADPQVDAEGGISMGGSAVVDQLDTDEYKAAEDACQHILDDAASAPPEGEEPLTPEERAALQDEWHAVAQCVRDQGYDFPTPEVDEYGRLSGIQAAAEGIEPAIEECVNQSDLSELPGGEGESSGEEGGS
jgi:hypothetical protein